MKEIADECGVTVEEEFYLMMRVGSRWDIDKKIAGWKCLLENSKKSQAASENGQTV